MLFIILFSVTFLLLGYLLGQMKITNTNKANYLARAAVIAAIYSLITYLFKPISYGMIQVRVSEALTLLPLIESSAIPGLFIGCLIANILGGMGPWDIYLGSIITLIAACITAKMPGPVLGSLPPIILNALGVSYYLSIIYDVPYLLTALYIGLGQAISVGGLGISLFYLIQRTSLKNLFRKE
ncbi:MAG: QueT transporter family protein [Thermoanaerobacteraceae bacterium]|nr:QueT transporter family protein [Thermoanaerobacteraceae bacterium]